MRRRKPPRAQGRRRGYGKKRRSGRKSTYKLTRGGVRL